VDATPRPAITRRRLLVGLLLVPGALGGASACSPGGASAPDEPDPLIALADAARADAALATAAIVADPELTDRVRPLVDARTAHAAALDAEVARLDPAAASGAPTVVAESAGPPPTLRQVREAVRASATAAGDVALELPVERVGLVASVAACCGTYAEVLT
jgi:hypothetical protein